MKKNNCEKAETGELSVHNFVILKMDRYSDKLIAKNIDGDHSLYTPLTAEDARKLDLIVMAAADTFTKTYAPYVNGERQEGDVTVRIGKAGLYYFDPATGRVAAEDTVHAANLGRQEENLQGEYKLSNGRIIKAVDERYRLDLASGAGSASGSPRIWASWSSSASPPGWA